MNYDDAVAWLYSTQRTGIKLGLDNIRKLLEAVNWRGAPYILHVAGTNGKGSVCAMLDAICREAGLITGLFTSPHLVTFRERIRLNGVNISESAVAEGITHIRELSAGWENPPTFFEITTALALRYFQQQGTQVIVLETGLGGRLDSTNAVTPSATIFTPIGIDHQQYLGNTLREIAGEKAGILKPNVPALSAPQMPDAADVLNAVAERVSAPLHYITEPFPSEVALAGSHQKLNAALAVAGLKAAAVPVTEAAIKNGLRNVIWPGRFQRIQESSGLFAGIETVLDGAHNPAAIERLAETWREVYRTEKPVVLLGVLQDKDGDAICKALSGLAAAVVVSGLQSNRSSTPEELAEQMARNAPGIPCSLTHSVEEAVTVAKAAAVASGRKLLITGSLFLIGEVLALISGSQPEVSAQ